MASSLSNYGSGGEPQGVRRTQTSTAADAASNARHSSSWPSVASVILTTLTCTACAVTCYCVSHSSWIDTYSYGPDGQFHHTVRIGLWSVCYDRVLERLLLVPACSAAKFSDFMLVTQICECIATGANCIAVLLIILQLARAGSARLRVRTRRLHEEKEKLMVLCHFVAVLFLLISLPLFLTSARLEGVEFSMERLSAALPYETKSMASDMPSVLSLPRSSPPTSDAANISYSPITADVTVDAQSSQAPQTEQQQQQQQRQNQSRMPSMSHLGYFMSTTAASLPTIITVIRPPNDTAGNARWQHLPAFSVFSFAVWFQFSGLALNATSMILAIRQHAKGRRKKLVRQQELEVRPRSESRRVLFRKTSQISMDAFPQND